VNRRVCLVPNLAILVGIVTWGAMLPQAARYRTHPWKVVANLLGHDSDCARSVRPEDPDVPGVPNFGQVTPTLLRGGQPTAAGLRSLQRQGVQLVVNFREDDEVGAERRAVEGLGMGYANIPWSATQNPDNRQVAEFLALLRDRSDTKVFVHCKAGRDRTGVMIAAFRIACQHWTPQQALEEMATYGFCGGPGTSHHHLELYVEGFPEQLRSSPCFLRADTDRARPPIRAGSL
jgi:protein tyrosine phosphatase (PTP) superfamily phosphohydrolase (DUF442 family)